MLAAGDDRVDPSAEGHDAKVEIVVFLGNILDFDIGHERAFVDTRGHHLHLPVGDVDHRVAGLDLEQPGDLLGGDLLGADHQIDSQVLPGEDRILLPQLQGADSGDLAGDSQLLGYASGHDVHRVVVRDRDHVVHLIGVGLGPAGKAHGVAPDQAGVHLTVGTLDQRQIRLDGRDGMSLVGKAFSQVIADAAQAYDQYLFAAFRHRSNPEFTIRELLWA